MRRFLALLFAGFMAIIPAVHANEWIGWFTEPLRLITNEALQFDIITRIIVLLFSVVVAFIGFLAWRKNSSSRVMIVALAFGIIAFKWLLKVMDLFVSSGQFFPDHAENVMELISLALIAYAIFSPRKER